MYKIYKKNDYIIIDDDVNSPEWYLSKDILVQEIVENVSYEIFGILPKSGNFTNQLLHKISIPNILKENGSPYSDTEWTDFYTSINANQSSEIGVVSTNNSTEIALNSGNTYTGVWEDSSNYSSIVISVATNRDGTYVIQFSTDGINIDSTLTRYYRTNQINVPHRFTVTRKYFRITFTNTSTVNQSYLRLQTLIGNQGELNIPIDSTMAQDFDSVSVRPTKYEYEVALGRRQGSTTWNKFGYNADLDIDTEILGAQGGTFTFLTTASTLTIVSSSLNDNSTGAGAKSIIIQGVDSNRDAVTEIVTLNGTTSVVTSSTWLGINRASVYLAGSNYANVGNITITATTGGSIQGFIPTGKGTTQQLIFFTQRKHKFLMDWLILDAERISGGGSNPRVQFRGWVWSEVNNCKYEVLYSLLDLNLESEHQFVPSQPFILDEKSVFWIEATTDVINTVVSGRFSGIEFRNIDF